MNDTPKYKRQRVNYEYTGKENSSFSDQPQHIAQVPFATNYNYSFLPSPPQELGHIDQLFNWLDGENGKSNNEYPPFNAMNDVFGINHVPDFGFLTPTMTEINFF
jgi:hypothetical protein